MPDKHKEGGKDGDGDRGLGPGRRTRRSSRGEKGEDEGRDADDTMNEEDEEDEEEEDEEEEDLWQAVHALLEFRPMTSFETVKQDEAAQAMPLMTSTDTTNVFFGNLPCYVFFRLYQKLYERLLKAKTLADDLQVFQP